jgi:hypothetical protein
VFRFSIAEETSTNRRHYVFCRLHKREIPLALISDISLCPSMRHAQCMIRDCNLALHMHIILEWIRRGL